MRSPVYRASVKEAIDNLPSGICFFDRRGVLVLCNIVMYRLAFALTGRDLQTRADLASALAKLPEESAALCDGDVFRLSDGSAWRFSRSDIRDAFGNEYTEYIATDVTELHEKQYRLRRSNAEQEKLAVYMRRIVDNVTAITREEEILSMKMLIHNEVGWCLQQTRQYYAKGCPAEEQQSLVAALEDMVHRLQGEIGQDDEPDPFDELRRACAAIGVGVTVQGELPQDDVAQDIIAAAVRECVTNTLRHAGGDRVTAEFSQRDTIACAVITNNGRQPQEEIVEGGGFSSLRRRVESAGGTMKIESLPSFALIITIPTERTDIPI